MSRDTVMASGSSEGPAKGTPGHVPHAEEEEPVSRQEVMSPGTDEREERRSRVGSAEGMPDHVPRTEKEEGPVVGQEVMSSGGEERRQREERSGLSPERRDRTSEQYVRRSLGRSLSSYPVRERRGQVDEPRGPGPFYFFGGANGADIVSSYCESRGWKRICNKHREDFKLKWCETKSPANYSNFRQGEQLVFQIPNNYVLTTKIGLLSSLREYERVSSKVQHGQGHRRCRRLKMDEFIPTTFRMDIREEREAFFSQHEGLSNTQKRMWICKPTGLNQGRGIFLLKSQEDVSSFRHKLQETGQREKTPPHHHRQPQARIVQSYIQNPLLLKGRKFDVRSYLIIACAAPYMVFFRHGYVRLTCDLYDPNTNNMAVHLTNQCMQKKNPLYSQLKEDTVWSMESFNAYVNDRFTQSKDLPRDWVLSLFTKRMQQIMTQCFLSVKSKLDCRLGFFDLIGCDFMIDEDFNVWLLEMNCNPALHTNCSVLKEVIPSTVHETLDLTLEIFNKCRRGQRILPLSSQRDFALLFKGPPNSIPLRNKTRAPLHCELTQKTTRKSQKSDLHSHTEPLTSSEKVLASGEDESAPCDASSPPQRTFNNSHRPRRKKVPLKSGTFHNQVSTNMNQKM